MSRHDEERKVRHEIVPYLLAAELLGKQTICRLHWWFGLGQLVIAGLAGLGFASPLLPAMQGVGGTNSSKSASSEPGALLHGIGIAGLILLVAWTLLWAYLTKEDGQKRALLAKSCETQLRSQSVALRKAMIAVAPIEPLTQIGEKVQQIVDRAIAEGAWPWNPLPDDERFTTRCSKRCTDELAKRPPATPHNAPLPVERMPPIPQPGGV